MEWLNYQRLLYFWTIVREGSIARACEKLRLAPPTISRQLRLLEKTLDEELFVKQGCGLAMTEVGQVVFRYADEIFGLGRELQDVLKGRPRGRPLRLFAGVSDLIPKLVAYRVLRPALEMPEPVQIICDEGPPEHQAELAGHRMAVVLSDAPIPPTVFVKAYNHLLGTSTATIFAAPKVAARYRKTFPACLDGAPFLLPMHGSSPRRPLEQWFDSENIRPFIVGEFKDRALMTTFGQGGRGPLCSAHRDRRGDSRAVPGGFGGPRRFHRGALLRCIRRKKTQAPSCRKDLRSGARNALPQSRQRTVEARRIHRLTRWIASERSIRQSGSAPLVWYLRRRKHQPRPDQIHSHKGKT